MNESPAINRRTLLKTLSAAGGGALAAVSLAPSVSVAAADATTQSAKIAPQTAAGEEKPKEYSRKIKIGIIGGGHRGNFIGNLMKKHGGYEIHAVADYFPEVAEKLGDSFGVDKSRRFSGLSGYKRVIESGIEALGIFDVPYFYAEQATAAAAAGCHIYSAKPIAVDAPGCLAIEAAGKMATAKQRCFLVDYQLPLDPANAEVASRIRAGGLGPIAHILSFGKTGAWADPPKGATIESRLRSVIWLSDIALSGDTIVSYDIHIIDPIIGIMGKRVAGACGRSRICRPEPHGDRIDACGVVFEFDDGVLWTHVLQSLNNNSDYGDLVANVMGAAAAARLAYNGKCYIKGGDKHFVGTVSSGIYNEGATKNVADFYSNITEGRFDNPTVKRAVDGTLTAILGREAAARRKYLTMDELIQENKKLTVDLTGLKA
ncbi:MAG: Gfo/Idh/MocA family oxidoreductase [Candidatus Sumerlaeota bacterium]|nr:Gfo/Idh/MocA family oxidoreductase [Candidatus Sumerlaeota bacterium]